MSALVYLLICSVFLEGAIACVLNAPRYENGGWDDDPEIPDWRLRRRDGDRSIVLLMNNYIFNCTGRLTTWYLWWIVEDTNEDGCVVAFTPHVLRRPPPDNQDCSLQVVGSHREERHFSSSDESRIFADPEMFTSQEDVFVRPGDFIALEIAILSGCSSNTEAWMRGRVEPNSVFFRRYEELTSTISEFRCISEPYDERNSGRGFISAYVEPIVESSNVIGVSTQTGVISTSIATTLTLTSETTTATKTLNTEGAVIMTTAARHMEVESTTIPPSIEPMFSAQVLPTTASGKNKHSTIEVTSFRVEATPAGTSGYNVFLENVLLLVVVGSLVSSSVMLLTCMMCVCIHTFKRKKNGKNERVVLEASPTRAATPTTVEPVRESRADVYYDYPVLQSQLTTETFNSSPAIFTTYL